MSRRPPRAALGLVGLGLGVLAVAAGTVRCGGSTEPTPARGRPPSTSKDVANFTQIMFVYRLPNGGKAPHARAEAEALARDMIRRVRAGEGMALLVRNYTDDRDEATGLAFNDGSYTIARFQTQVIASVRDAVFSLRAGELRPEPLDTGLAYLVIRRDE